MTSATPPPIFESIAIIGVGLIGGSIALAAKKHGAAKRVIGIGRSRERLELAQQAGVIDDVCVGIAELGSLNNPPKLVIVCTPVDRIVGDVLALAAVVPPSTLITDAGSVKHEICEQLRLIDGHDDRPAFVGSHPLAGSEKQGWEQANADLFQDRLCVVTPDDRTDAEATDRVKLFWQQLGMNTQRLTPVDHDRALAATSHLPHAVAAALMRTLASEHDAFAATGFRSTARIAGGDPAVWVPIFLQNADNLVQEVDGLIEQLQLIKGALADQDEELLETLLGEARVRFNELQQHAP